MYKAGKQNGSRHEEEGIPWEVNWMISSLGLDGRGQDLSDSLGTILEFSFLNYIKMKVCLIDCNNGCKAKEFPTFFFRS